MDRFRSRCLFSLIAASQTLIVDLHFSDHFKNIIICYKRIGYNIYMVQQCACLVLIPITVNNFASLFNCTSVGRASDSMMARHKAIYFSWLGPELFCLLLGPLLVFFCSSVPVVLFDQVSPGVGRNTLFLSSPHLCFIIVSTLDLIVSRVDPLIC